MKIINAHDLSLELRETGRQISGLKDVIEYGLAKRKNTVIVASIFRENIRFFTDSLPLAAEMKKKIEACGLPVRASIYHSMAEGPRSIFSLDVLEDPVEVREVLSEALS